jgi:ribonuclease I
MELYKYYLLAVQNWCSTEYKIHGLWSDITSTKYPSYCTTVPFNLTELQQSEKYSLISEAWTDCNYSETVGLYEHEWSKHGTCIALQTGFSQNEYFERALELYLTNAPNQSICFDLDFTEITCPK